jgi:hypothetical protein
MFLYVILPHNAQHITTTGNLVAFRNSSEGKIAGNWGDEIFLCSGEAQRGGDVVDAVK